jgi:ribosomal protein L37E
MTEYKCAICGKPINKNHESYRGRMSAAMIAEIRKKVPAFHPKNDVCKECGESYAEKTKSAAGPAWMSRPLG